jgi:peptide-methionine (R)-S-oxide reductase
MFRHRQKVSAQERAQEKGGYTCASCGSILFEASKKFDVGSGFPSFWAQVKDRITHRPLHTYGRSRIQLLCSLCGLHLGHLFDDVRTPTQVRYCINKDVLHFEVYQDSIPF